MSPVTPAQYRTRVLARARDLAQDLAQDRPDLRTRIERALRLLETGALVERPGAPWAAWVRSTRGHGGYRLSANTGCECPDIARAPKLGRLPACKHWLAYLLLTRAAWEPAPRESNIIPFPTPHTLDPDAPIPYELTLKALRLLDGEGPEAA